MLSVLVIHDEFNFSPNKGILFTIIGQIILSGLKNFDIRRENNVASNSSGIKLLVADFKSVT